MGPFDFVNPSQPAPVAAPATAPLAQPPVATPQPAAQPPAQAGAIPDQNTSGWVDFLTRLKTDPNLQQQMLSAGTAMLQGQRPGENFNGLIGRSLQAGNLAGNFLRQNQLNAGQKQQEIDLEGERIDIQSDVAGSTIDAQGAQTDASRASTRRAGKLLPSEIAKNEAAAKKATGEAGVTDKLANASVMEAQARAVEANARAVLAGKTNPSIDDNTATLQSLATRYADEDAGQISGRFLQIQQEARLSPLIRSAQAILRDSFNPDEKAQAKEFLDAQYKKILDQQSEGASSTSGTKSAPKGMASPSTIAERDKLPVGTEYWDQFKQEVRTRQK